MYKILTRTSLSVPPTPAWLSALNYSNGLQPQCRCPEKCLLHPHNKQHFVEQTGGEPKVGGGKPRQRSLGQKLVDTHIIVLWTQVRREQEGEKLRSTPTFPITPEHRSSPPTHERDSKTQRTHWFQMPNTHTATAVGKISSHVVCSLSHTINPVAVINLIHQLLGMKPKSEVQSVEKRDRTNTQVL